MRWGLTIVALAYALGSASPAAGGTGILAVGDFGVGGRAERTLGASIRRFEARRPAELLVTLGDNDYTRSPDAFARNWRAGFGWLEAAGVAVAGTIGNHDYEVGRGGYELGLLGMPRRYYTRRVGDVELFLLDSNDVDRAQTAWLRRALARSTARWRIAVFHHPAFSCSLHDGDPRVQRLWVPLFRRYGVQLALSGHDHNYQRFAPRGGVTYVVDGGGQPRLYDLDACPASYPQRVAGIERRGFLYLNAGERSLEGFAVGLDGRVADSFAIYP